MYVCVLKKLKNVQYLETLCIRMIGIDIDVDIDICFLFEKKEGKSNKHD